MSCSCSSCARRRDESVRKGSLLFANAIAFLSTVHPRHESTSASSHDPPFLFDRPSEIFTSRLRSRSRHPRLLVHFASLHAARHRTNRSTRAYLRGDLAMVRATKPARASPRAFAKHAAVDSRFLSLSAFSRREVTKNPKRASTGPSSRGETRARRNESARVPRVPAPRARATLVHSTTHRGSLTEAHPPNRARTRRLAGTSPMMTRTLFDEHARS